MRGPSGLVAAILMAGMAVPGAVAGPQQRTKERARDAASRKKPAVVLPNLPGETNRQYAERMKAEKGGTP